MLEPKSKLRVHPPQGLRIRIPKNEFDEEDEGGIVDDGQPLNDTREDEKRVSRQNISSLFWKYLEALREICKALFSRRSSTRNIKLSPGSIKPVEKL
jgi:hypothetical protein